MRRSWCECVVQRKRCLSSIIPHGKTKTRKQQEKGKFDSKKMFVCKEKNSFSHFIPLPPAFDDVFRCLLMLCINCLASSMGLCCGAGVREGWMKKSLEFSHFRRRRTRENIPVATFVIEISRIAKWIDREVSSSGCWQEGAFLWDLNSEGWVFFRDYLVHSLLSHWLGFLKMNSEIKNWFKQVGFSLYRKHCLLYQLSLSCYWSVCLSVFLRTRSWLLKTQSAQPYLSRKTLPV